MSSPVPEVQPPVTKQEPVPPISQVKLLQFTTKEVPLFKAAASFLTTYLSVQVLDAVANWPFILISVKNLVVVSKLVLKFLYFL
jgi:hypothetical protein